jgi:hypothetical protein
VTAIGLLKVLEDASVQLQNMSDALFLHVKRSLFAADASGAIRHHGLACQHLTMPGQR